MTRQLLLRTFLLNLTSKSIFSGDPAFKFFYGMALVLEGQLQEGIRELDTVQNYTEVQLGSLLALIYAHKKCSTVDREAVAALDTKLKDERKRADDQVSS